MQTTGIFKSCTRLLNVIKNENNRKNTSRNSGKVGKSHSFINYHYYYIILFNSWFWFYWFVGITVHYGSRVLPSGSATPELQTVSVFPTSPRNFRRNVQPLLGRNQNTRGITKKRPLIPTLKVSSCDSKENSRPTSFPLSLVCGCRRSFLVVLKSPHVGLSFQMNRNPLRKHKHGIWARGRPGGGLKVPAAFQPLCSALTSASWQGLTYREEVKQTDIAGRNSPDTHGRRVSEEVGSAGVTFFHRRRGWPDAVRWTIWPPQNLFYKRKEKKKKKIHPLQTTSEIHFTLQIVSFLETPQLLHKYYLQWLSDHVISDKNNNTKKKIWLARFSHIFLKWNHLCHCVLHNLIYRILMSERKPRAH